MLRYVIILHYITLYEIAYSLAKLGLLHRENVGACSRRFCPISPKPISSIGENNRTLTLTLFLTLNLTL